MQQVLRTRVNAPIVIGQRHGLGRTAQSFRHCQIDDFPRAVFFDI